MDYWRTEHPILLQALADQTPGIELDAVAELLVDVEQELVSESEGVMVIAGDDTVVLAYLDLLTAHHGKHSLVQ
jgi:hypothetical protein